MYGWALEAGKVTHNPFTGVKSTRRTTTGFKPWTIDQVRQYVARHPIGTSAYLAMMIFLFTGFRRGDACRLGPQHARDGWFTLETEKTGVVAEVPIMPPLARAIAATTTGINSYLVTSHGKPFAKAGFGNWFRDRIAEAGLPNGIAAHGIRKALAELLAEFGCTETEIMAILAHTTTRETGTYTRGAERKRLAASAMKKLEGFAL
jgi:integrase